MVLDSDLIAEALPHYEIGEEVGRGGIVLASFDTGIDVKAGDEVKITATGTVIHDLTTPTTLVSGPDGDADRPDLQQYNVLSGFDHANLIGRIGENGAPFAVGSKLDFTADSDGRLFLGVNDVGFQNNGGEYEARVSVS